MDISLLFPLLILLLFIPIFLSGRRQRKQVADMKALQESLEPGDIVMTTSGLRATVVDSTYEDTVDLEIADGVVTTWVRAAVKEKVAEPVVADDLAELDPTTDATTTDATTTAATTAATTDAVTTTGTAVTGAGTDGATTDADTTSTTNGVTDAPPSLDKDDSTNGTSRS